MFDAAVRPAARLEKRIDGNAPLYPPPPIKVPNN